MECIYRSWLPNSPEALYLFYVVVRVLQAAS